MLNPYPAASVPCCRVTAEAVAAANVVEMFKLLPASSAVTVIILSVAVAVNPAIPSIVVAVNVAKGTCCYSTV